MRSGSPLPASRRRLPLRRLVVLFAVALAAVLYDGEAAARAATVTSASHALEPAFTGGSGLLASPSFRLTGCLDLGLAEMVTSSSHGLVAGCGALTILASDIGRGFYVVTPCRVFDSRAGAGPLASGTPLSIPVAGLCGIAPTAKAVAVNVTAVGPTGGGHLEVFPSDLPPPPVPVLPFNAGQTRANNAIVSLAADGSLTLQPFLPGGGDVHVILDVTGYVD